ncbi:MAG: (Fe-S)-binding protein, partial [Desulfobacteraceae bacterium]|nr:(Fe-S)-binding protein [Desulfobacteraceae bacterium]
KGLSPAKKLIFRNLLAHPGRFDTLLDWAGRFQGVFTKPDTNAQGTSCARLVSPLLSHRHFMPLSTTPFHKTLPENGGTDH